MFVQCGEASSVGRLELDGDWSNWAGLRAGGGTVLKAVQDGAAHGEFVKIFLEPPLGRTTAPHPDYI